MGVLERHHSTIVTATTHQGKRHNNTWVEPLTGNCTTSSTRQSNKCDKNVKYKKKTDALSLWHQQYSTTVDIHGPLQIRGVTRCLGGVEHLLLGKPHPPWMPIMRLNKGYIRRLDTGCGPTLYRKCHSHNTPGKRHNKTWVEPLAGHCTTSSTRQREQVLQKCKIQNNWCTVTVAPTIEHHSGHSRTPQTRGETRCPGRVSVSCLANRTRHECPRHNKGYIWRRDTGCGLTLYRKCQSHNKPGKRHNNTWVEPLAGNCTISSTRQKEQVWQKCIIQKNWCTVTVAPTIDHHVGHSRTPANQRWDQVPGRSQRLLLGKPHPPWMPATQQRVYMKTWHWMWTLLWSSKSCNRVKFIFFSSIDFST